MRAGILRWQRLSVPYQEETNPWLIEPTRANKAQQVVYERQREADQYAGGGSDRVPWCGALWAYRGALRSSQWFFYTGAGNERGAPCRVIGPAHAGNQALAFERSHRRREAVESTMGERFGKGVSQAQGGQVMETLTGSPPSTSTVSRIFPTLEAEDERRSPMASLSR